MSQRRFTLDLNFPRFCTWIGKLNARTVVRYYYVVHVVVLLIMWWVNYRYLVSNIDRTRERRELAKQLQTQLTDKKSQLNQYVRSFDCYLRHGLLNLWTY
jgi:uncharacterized membrane protein